MKKCSKCKIEKELIDFNKNKAQKDGCQNHCKICIKEYKIKNKEKNKEYKKEYSKKYHLKNKEKINEVSKKYYLNNKEIIKKKYQIKKKQYYLNNLDTIKENYKKWYIENKEIRNQYNREYQKNRRLNDNLFRLKCNIITSIGKSFRRNGYSKKTKTFQILGCTYKEFKYHLEKQFTKGMSWDNQGEWHLDHIYPVSLAKDEEELIRLNHYTNFQPLWAIDNLKKSNKIIDNTQLKLI